MTNNHPGLLLVRPSAGTDETDASSVRPWFCASRGAGPADAAHAYSRRQQAVRARWTSLWTHKTQAYSLHVYNNSGFAFSVAPPSALPCLTPPSRRTSGFAKQELVGLRYVPRGSVEAEDVRSLPSPQPPLLSGANSAR